MTPAIGKKVEARYVPVFNYHGGVPSTPARTTDTQRRGESMRKNSGKGNVLANSPKLISPVRRKQRHQIMFKPAKGSDPWWHYLGMRLTRILLLLSSLCLASIAQPTGAVLERTLRVQSKFGTGTIFSIDVDGREYWITAAHIVTGATGKPYGRVKEKTIQLQLLDPGGINGGAIIAHRTPRKRRFVAVEK